jgi:prepilin-type N-terminal cleavage/methylation domain-containing protein
MRSGPSSTDPKEPASMAEIFRKYLTRARSEKGFTLIELLVVLVILGILLAIAVPSYIGFKDRSERKAAGANVRAAIPAAEADYSDNGSYTGMDEAALKLIDAGEKASVGSAATTSYCLYNTQGNYTYHFDGPGGADGVTVNAC